MNPVTITDQWPAWASQGGGYGRILTRVFRPNEEVSRTDLDAAIKAFESTLAKRKAKSK